MQSYYLKKMCAVTLALVAGATASPMQADDLGYLRLVKSSGEISELTANQLVITFADGNLIATPAEGEVLTLPLADMQSMYFAKTSTDISLTPKAAQPQSNEADDGIYTLGGQRIGNSQSALPKGIYVVKKHGETLKTVIR